MIPLVFVTATIVDENVMDKGMDVESSASIVVCSSAGNMGRF